MQQPSDFEHPQYDIGKKYTEEKKEGFKGNQYTKSGEAQDMLQQTTADKLA